MFVRLFVDENLDRHVPISKQPKEKIQAIIDSCTRQFPEYSERSRKRIRTYLKSCRRTKRSREQAGLDINNVSIQSANINNSSQQSGGNRRNSSLNCFLYRITKPLTCLIHHKLFKHFKSHYLVTTGIHAFLLLIC